jgi:hypothetical protein
MDVSKYLEKEFLVIGWFLQQGTKKSEKLSGIAYFFSRVMGEGRDITPVMEALTPVYNSLTKFCQNEIKSHKGGLLGIYTGEKETQEEELVTLSRFKRLLSGIDQDALSRMFLLMENLYCPDFLVMNFSYDKDKLQEGYILAWILYLLPFDEESLNLITPIVIRLDSQTESF